MIVTVWGFPSLCCWYICLCHLFSVVSLLPRPFFAITSLLSLWLPSSFQHCSLFMFSHSLIFTCPYPPLTLSKHCCHCYYLTMVIVTLFSILHWQNTVPYSFSLWQILASISKAVHYITLFLFICQIHLWSKQWLFFMQTHLTEPLPLWLSYNTLTYMWHIWVLSIN